MPSSFKRNTNLMDDYPASFSAGMKAHCQRGCIPPSVFNDLADCASSAHPPQAMTTGGSRQGGAALARYVRLHPHAIPVLLEMGAILLERELLPLVQRNYSSTISSSSSSSADATTEIRCARRGHASIHSEQLPSKCGNDEWVPVAEREPTSSSPDCACRMSSEPRLPIQMVPLALRFHDAMLCSIVEALYGALEENETTEEASNDFLKGGEERQNEGKEAETKNIFTPPLALEPQQVRSDCFQRVPAMLLLWFAMSHLLRVPLLYVSPVLWLLPDAPLTTPPNCSRLSSAACLLASPTWISSQYFMFSFSPHVSTTVRGCLEDHPLLCRTCSCRTCCYPSQRVCPPLDSAFPCSSLSSSSQGAQNSTDDTTKAISGSGTSACAIKAEKSDGTMDMRHRRKGQKSPCLSLGHFLSELRDVHSPVPLSFFFTPMDAASLVTVLALEPAPGERVLDVCCSPGMKLQALAEKVQGKQSASVDEKPLNGIPSSAHRQSRVEMEASGGREQEALLHKNKNENFDDGKESVNGNGFVVGVDIDLHRLCLTRSLLQQYRNPFPETKKEGLSAKEAREVGDSTWPTPTPLPVALFHGDGTQFTLHDALQCVTSQQPVWTARRGDGRSISVPVAVSSTTGLTAKEAQRLKKKHLQLAKEKSHSSMPTTSSSPRLVRDGEEEQQSSSSSKRPVAPLVIFAPTPVRDAIAKAAGAVDTLHENSETRSVGHMNVARAVEPGGAKSPADIDAVVSKKSLVGPLFDAALVDVECTHDGSLAHLALQQQPPTTTTPGEASSSAVAMSSQPREDQDRSTSGDLHLHFRRSNAYRMAHLHLRMPHGETSALAAPLALIEARPPPSSSASLQQHLHNDDGGDRYCCSSSGDLAGTCGTAPSDMEASIPTSPLLQRWPCLRDVVCGDEDPFFLWLREDSLLQLQLSLLLHSFEQIRERGRLVYSTCSMSYQQNEYVVQCFLRLVNGKEALFPLHAAKMVCPFGICGHSSSNSNHVPKTVPAHSDSLAIPSVSLDAASATGGASQQPSTLYPPINGNHHVSTLLSRLCDMQDQFLDDPFYLQEALSERQCFSRAFVPRAMSTRSDFLHALESSLDLYGVVSEGERRLQLLMKKTDSLDKPEPTEENGGTPEHAAKKRFRLEENTAIQSLQESVCKHVNGVRMWPLVFKTSFQFIAKVEKVSRLGME